MPNRRPPAHWLLDLDVHGRVFRYADRPVSVGRDDGTTAVYGEGLPDLELPLVGEGTLSRSVTLDIVDGTDWPLLESCGQSPHRASAVLRWWRDGSTLEQARVVLRGVALVTRLGTKGEGISLAITRAPSASPHLVPPANAVIDDTTWAFLLPSSSRGLVYNLVIGSPGNDEDLDRTLTIPECVVPTPLVLYNGFDPADSMLLVGAEKLVPGTTTRIFNATTGAAGNSGDPLEHNFDWLGRTVTVARFGTSGVIGSPDDAYYVGFGGTWGGGLYSPYSDGVLRSADEVIRWALARSGRAVDDAMLTAYSPELAGYLVDTWINARVDLLEWLDAAVLSWLPVVVVEGQRGLYVRVLRYTARAQDALAHLVEGSGVERVGGLVRVDDSPCNEVVVRFKRGRNSDYGESVVVSAQAGVLSADEPGTADTRILGSALAARSQAYHGRVYSDTIQLDATWDRATAIRVAEDTLERRGLPRRVITYEGGTELDSLLVGDPVIVTDEAMYLAEAPAVVVEITLSTAAATVTVALVDGVR